MVLQVEQKSGPAGQKRQKVDGSHGGIKGVDGKEYEYCPYNDTSQSYDQTRSPLGVSIGLGFAQQWGGALHKQDLLDLGCGTGTFLKIVKDSYKSVTGLEYNDGMIGEARKLLGDSVKLVQGSADKMPFEDNSFNVVCINQVIHHFPADGGFKYLGSVLSEIARVLRPNGTLVLNHSTPTQQRDSFWWLSLFPRTSPVICARFAPLEDVKRLMVEAGFLWDADSVTVPLHRSLMAESSYLTGGVKAGFDKQYQDGDSSWAMAEACGELAEGLAKLQAMIDQGQATAWLEKREELRLAKGQATFITVRIATPK